MLQRQPFRSHVYKPFLSIGCLCLLERPRAVGAQPAPHPVSLLCCFGVGFCSCFQQNDSGTSLAATLALGGSCRWDQSFSRLPLLGGTSPGRTRRLQGLRRGGGRTSAFAGPRHQRPCFPLLRQEGHLGVLQSHRSGFLSRLPRPLICLLSAIITSAFSLGRPGSWGSPPCRSSGQGVNRGLARATGSSLASVNNDRFISAIIAG